MHGLAGGISNKMYVERGFDHALKLSGRLQCVTPFQPSQPVGMLWPWSAGMGIEFRPGRARRSYAKARRISSPCGKNSQMNDVVLWVLSEV